MWKITTETPKTNFPFTFAFSSLPFLLMSSYFLYHFIICLLFFGFFSSFAVPLSAQSDLTGMRRMKNLFLVKNSICVCTRGMCTFQMHKETNQHKNEEKNEEKIFAKYLSRMPHTLTRDEIWTEKKRNKNPEWEKIKHHHTKQSTKATQLLYLHQVISFSFFYFVRKWTSRTHIVELSAPGKRKEKKQPILIVHMIRGGWCVWFSFSPLGFCHHVLTMFMSFI